MTSMAELPTISHWLNGKLVAGQSGRTAPVYHPSTGEVRATVSLASPGEVDQAVALARIAFPGWAHTTPLRRARIMFKFRELLEENMDKLALIIAA